MAQNGTQASYGAESIQILEGLTAVRKRPAMYIGSTDSRGLHHLINEVVDNSIDEVLRGACTDIQVVLGKDGTCTVSDNGGGIPVEEHPRYHRPTLEIVMTVLHAGGKFDRTTYKVSGGLHGVGIHVVNALSEYVEVEVQRGGRRWSQRFERGVPAAPIRDLGPAEPPNATGTRVRFKPDAEIFETTVFDKAIVEGRLRELAFLNPEATIRFVDERDGTDQTFRYPGGIQEFVQQINQGKNVLFAPPVYFHAKADHLDLEVALQYNDGYNELVLSYANNINTVDGGTHLVGFRSALTRVLNDYARKRNFLKNAADGFTGEDVREGLVALVSVKVLEPQFEGQTKTRLGNSEVKGLVESSAGTKLAEYLEEHPQAGQAIIVKALQAAEAREAARKARELTRRKGLLEGGGLPGRLADCHSRNPADCELFIVEGESAGGCLSGDTRVPLADGRCLSLREIVDAHARGEELVGFTVGQDGRIVPARLESPRRTRVGARVVRVLLDDGASVTCTPDHPFLLRNGEYRPAGRLRAGDSLMPFYTSPRASPPLEEPAGAFWFWDPSARSWSSSLSGGDGSPTAAGARAGFSAGPAPFASPGENHRVVGVTGESEPRDVYDLEVPGTHNFALAAGVFVHNSAKQGRDREFQAILALRGKILNVEKARLDKMLQNEYIRDIITALGTNIGEEFDLSRLRYHRVIIMTDADVDGSHIRTLLLTFFYRKMRELVEGGHLYIAQPPLYRLVRGREQLYCYSDEERDRQVEAWGGMKGVTISRYKGLGEMNPGQLWETTMKPAARVLLQVTVEDAALANDLFTILMGEAVEPRRRYIEEHATEVSNLDT